MEHRPSPGKLAVGKRYINTKNNQSLTLLYIGPLPPSNPSERGSSSSTTQWLGVEYDDPEFGKGHSGTYEGLQIFQTRQEGAGAFIKLRTGNEFVEGKTFIDAIKGRYGYGCGLESDGHGEGMQSVILGSSSSAIVVEAPGMEGVTKRLRSLEKLRQIGLENEHISGVGGTEEERRDLGKRLKGVTMLNISRNLMSTWTEVEEILQVVSGVSTLIMNDSRLDLPSSPGTIVKIKEIYFARSLITWTDVAEITRRFDQLEELHLTGNPLLSKPMPTCIQSDTIRILSIDECEMKLWDDIEKAIERFPRLDTLNISCNPLGSLLDNSQLPTLKRLKNLVLLSSTLDSHVSLSNLSARIPDLEILRFSLAPNTQLASDTVGPRLSGNDEEDGGVLIALFPNLRLLNGNTVNLKQREDAERRWCARFSSSGSATTLERLHEKLSKKHGLQSSSPIARAQSTSLRSRLITLHVYPSAPSIPFTLPVLPSAPTSLVRRKLAKRLGAKAEGIRMFMVKRIQNDDVHAEAEAWTKEKVAEIEEGEIGYWFDDGDGIIVESQRYDRTPKHIQIDESPA